MYTSLHNHTHYSNIRIIDSINTEETLIDRAFELGLNGVAITDHETVSGHIKALNYYNKKYAEKKNKFKLILGNEIYITRRDLTPETHEKGEKFYHFILIAKDDVGHKQIRELSTRAWKRSYVKNLLRVPTFLPDIEEIIGSNKGHIIGTTACLGGYTGQMFAMQNWEMMDTFIETMDEIFGHGDFYIELQPSIQNDQQAYNLEMINRYWGKYPFIFTTDSHYLRAEDRKIHKRFLQSKTSVDREVDDFYHDAYLMNYEDVCNLFSSAGIRQEFVNEMCDNTNKINNSIQEYNLTHNQIVPKIIYEHERFDDGQIGFVANLFTKNGLKNYQYLNYFMNSNDEADQYFINLILEGYYNKFCITNDKLPIQERMKRLDYELEQVRETSIKIGQSLSDYFITMAKMIELIWDEGDSMVGPGRGSAAGFLVNYLLGITQLDPMTQMLYMPPWRFIHKDRPGLPDIDIDTEATKRVRVFNKIQQYFNKIGSDLINVCTFGTEGSKSAIRTAARGLDIDDTVVSYLTSMIPNERGFDLTLHQCYYGDEDHKPIKEFVATMDENKDLWELACGIEGLVTRLGVHASGVLIVGEDSTTNNSIMRTSRGITVSAYSLEDSEQFGGLKYDMLTVQGLDKLHATINYLLDDRVIEWQGSLKKTYDKYLLPANLNYTDKGMWEMLSRGEIIDVFQFDTMVGSQAIRQIQPHNVGELAVANSIMRLMAQEGMELPLETYVKYKNNLNLWYREMEAYGLTDEEIEAIEPILKPLYGVADSQEAAMMLVMEPRVANFTITESNSLRKAIAKKDEKVLQKTKTMFYEKGKSIGTSDNLLNYIWNVQIGRQIGYSFSILHTMAYSTIALQQMNLAYFYNPIYWKTACLSVNAGAINEEDYYNLVDEGVIELSDEDDKRNQTKIQYGKVASAIGNYKGQINIKLPDINTSRLGFTPDIQTNSIRYGIKGIARVGDNIIQEIILNRPYKSLKDFVDRMYDIEEKKLISRDKLVNLIKAGAFDALENKPRDEILVDFLHLIVDQKERLTLQNFLMLIRKNLVPKELEEEKKCYNFTKYIRKSRYKNYYILDDIAIEYIIERFPKERIQEMIGPDGSLVKVISDSWWDNVYDFSMNKVRNWLRLNEKELLSKLNNELYKEEFQKYAKGDILDWELQALNFFHSGHPLNGVELPIEITKLADIREGEIKGFFLINGKQIPELRLSTIVGTVIDKDKVKSIVTLSTPDGVIDVKFYKQQYAKFAHESENEDEHNEDNFFEKGTHLAITGVKRGDMFVPKVYKRSGIDPIMKIELDENRKFVKFYTKI